MATVINGIDGLKSSVGNHLGYSSYMTISQERVKNGENPLFQSHMWDGSAIPIDENLGGQATRVVVRGHDESVSSRAEQGNSVACSQRRNSAAHSSQKHPRTNSFDTCQRSSAGCRP